MQLNMRDCLEGQPTHGHENFSKIEKDPRLSNATVSKKAGQKSQTKFQAMTGQDNRKRPKAD